jgi:hypothetical protein
MRGGFKLFVTGAALIALAAAASPAAAQEPTPTPATQQPQTTPAEEKIVFPLPEKCQQCDVALITMLIKPDRTADFEQVMAKVKEALAKSENPQRQEQAKGWIIFKSPTPVQGNAVYVMRIDPIVKGAEYDLMRIVAEVFPTEAQEIYQKYRDAFAGRAVTELQHLMSMSQ